MKKILFSLAIACFFTQNQANAQQVKNIRIEADDEKVTINYDLIATGAVRTYNVCLRSGNPAITPKNTTGAIGKNRTTGINQKIEWYYSNDGYSQEQINNLKIEVIAIDPNNPRNNGMALPKPKKVPIYAGLGTVSLAGLGLAIGGIAKRGDAQTNYDIYKNNLSPNAPIYTELGLTRDELYEEANGSNKKAQLMMIGGGVVFGAAAYILVNRIIWIKRIENRRSQAAPTNLQCALHHRPSLQLSTVSVGNSAGLGLSLRF
jgi:hypothetical protein